MTGQQSADYERGWQAAIDHLSPPGSQDRAALNTAATGLVRRFADAMTRLGADMDRIARTMAALDVDPDERRRTEDAAWHSIWLHGDWRWLTRNMTTEERTAAADAVERHWDVVEAQGQEPRDVETRAVLRWWEQ